MRVFHLDDKEDEIEKIRKAFQKRIKAIKEYVTASDYVEGIKKVEKQDFDLYLLDGEFPYQEGKNENKSYFIKEIRQLKKDPNIIVCSGYGKAPKNRKKMHEFDPHIPFYSKSETQYLVEKVANELKK